MERSTNGSQRCALDSSHRRALERPALAVRPIPDSAPPIPELGSLRSDRKNPTRAGRASQRGRRPRPYRVLRGWDFRTRQKRGLCVGKTKRGKGTKIMGIADSHGLPIALRTENASPAEVKLVAATLEERVLPDVPERLIGDKAYDSDGLDNQLMQDFGTEMISPHRHGRKVPTQDGRPLRRYARRWKVERMFAWLFNFRRLVVRYEYHANNFQGFVHLAAAIILLRHL